MVNTVETEEPFVFTDTRPSPSHLPLRKLGVLVVNSTTVLRTVKGLLLRLRVSSSTEEVLVVQSSTAVTLSFRRDTLRLQVHRGRVVCRVWHGTVG